MVDDSSPGDMALSPLSLHHSRHLGIMKRSTGDDFLAAQAGTREARGGPDVSPTLGSSWAQSQRRLTVLEFPLPFSRLIASQRSRLEVMSTPD